MVRTPDRFLALRWLVVPRSSASESPRPGPLRVHTSASVVLLGGWRRYVGSEPGMVLYLGCSRWSICRTLPGPPASPGGCWTRGPDQGTGLRGFLALPPPPPQFLRFSVLGPAPPSLAADVVSFLVLGLQLGTAAVLGALGASAALAAPGVARAARAAPPPRDDSPAAVTMTTAVR